MSETTPASASAPESRIATNPSDTVSLRLLDPSVPSARHAEYLVAVFQTDGGAHDDWENRRLARGLGHDPSDERQTTNMLVARRWDAELTRSSDERSANLGGS